MDYAVNQRINLSERNCINLCERYRIWHHFQINYYVKVFQDDLTR